MKTKEVYTRAKIQSIIMEDLVFRSPLWALLILLIYGIIMSGAMWFLLCVVKPSIDKKMQGAKSSQIDGTKAVKLSEPNFEFVS